MMVHSNIVHIIIREHFVPCVRSIVVETIMEDEGGIGVIFSKNFSNLLIIWYEPLLLVRVPPWLIDWFESTKSGMITPSFDKIFTHVNRSVKVLHRHVLILSSSDIPVSLPISLLIRPVAEMSVVNPL